MYTDLGGTKSLSEGNAGIVLKKMLKTTLKKMMMMMGFRLSGEMLKL